MARAPKKKAGAASTIASQTQSMNKDLTSDPATARQDKAMKTRARNRAEEEKTQLEEAERVIASGPRASKSKAGEKVRGWISTTRKRTHSETAANTDEPTTPLEETGTKRSKISLKSRLKPRADVASAQLPRSLLNHDHGDDESDESPLAAAVHRPLKAKPIVKNASKPRRQTKTTPLDNADDQDWPSDGNHDAPRGYGDSDRSEEWSEVSDSGVIDTKTEVPKWIDDKHDQEVFGEVHDIVHIPSTIEEGRSRRGSTTSNASMRTRSSVGPPPTASTYVSEDEELKFSNVASTRGRRRQRGTHSPNYDGLEEINGDHNDDDSDTEFPSTISNLPPGPIPGIRDDRTTRRRNSEDGQHKDNENHGRQVSSRRSYSSLAEDPDHDGRRREIAPSHRDDRHRMSSTHIKNNTKTRRQEAAEAERPKFREREDPQQARQEYGNRGHQGVRMVHSDLTGDDSGSMKRSSRYNDDDVQRDHRHTARMPVRVQDQEVHSTPSALQQTELQWPEETRLKYTSRHKVNKGEQLRPIQGFLDRVIEEFTLDMAFEQAIYKAEERFIHQCDLLIELAESMGMRAVARRLREDDRYARVLIYVGENRLTTFRGKLKATANGLIQGEYQLVPGDAAVRVGALLLSCQWIYPGDVLRTQDYKNPFNLSIFTNLLASRFFDGAKSIGAKNPELFKSSIRDKPHEKEIPEAMLALVCAVTAVALTDWISGTYSMPREFDIVLAEKYYDEVVAEMHQMKAKSIVMYHRVMHRVYKNVCELRSSGSLLPATGGPSKLVIDE